MGFGLFGKMPQKRDFVAYGLPRAVLEPFETWLQSAVAGSRNELGAAWQDHYLVAPMWRFWIGGRILGTGVAGALAPSVDAVGRFFPLAILYVEEPGEALAPPVFEPQDGWYATLEARLLSALDGEQKFEAAELVAGLDRPRAAEPPVPAPVEARRGLLWRRGGTAAELLAAAREAEHWAGCAGRSFWWMDDAAGGPVLYVRDALPDPFFYVDMLTGGSAPDRPR